MKRRHNMPFGAECCQDGKVRFRLWAPAARQVELCLGDITTAIHIPLERLDTGFSLRQRCDFRRALCICHDARGGSTRGARHRSKGNIGGL